MLLLVLTGLDRASREIVRQRVSDEFECSVMLAVATDCSPASNWKAVVTHQKSVEQTIDDVTFWVVGKFRAELGLWQNGRAT